MPQAGLRAMVQERPARVAPRLAAILAADVAGYSRLMHNDEEATHAKLTALLADGVTPAISQHGARFVNRHKALGFDNMQAFVDNFMTGYFAPMDPNNLLAMAWKWQRGDVSRNINGDLAATLGRIKANKLVMPISHDMFFPPADGEAEQRLIPGSEFRPLASIDGHLDLFGTEPQMLSELDAHLSDHGRAPSLGSPRSADTKARPRHIGFPLLHTALPVRAAMKQNQGCPALPPDRRLRNGHSALEATVSSQTPG
jgi:hypothetical protein